MAYKKYFKRQGRMIRRGLKSRYVRKTKTGKPYYNIGQMVRDVAYVKRSLNTERKQITFVSGTKTSTDDPTVRFQVAVMKPKDDAPVIQRLCLPAQGVKSFHRIGNQIKITHISAKIRVEAILENWAASVGPRLSTPYCKLMLGFYKPSDTSAGSGEPDIAEIYEKDSVGKYTRGSYRNTQNYKQFYFPKGCTKFITLNPSGIPPSGGSTANHDVVVERFVNINQRLNVKVPFQIDNSGTDEGSSNWGTAEGYRPFLLLMTNAEGTGLDGKSYVLCSAEIKLSYVDN